MMDERIVCAYLYTITKYGYPPNAEDTLSHIDEMVDLGFRSIELEGIREDHLLKVYSLKDTIANRLVERELNVPYFCAVLPALSSLDEKVRDRSLQLFEKACEIAVKFKSKGVLDNAPLPPFQFPSDIPVVRHYDQDVLNASYWPPEISWKHYWERLIDSYRTACQIAAKHSLTYLMHPAVGLLASNTDAFLRFFDAVKMDNLRFNFDSANQFVMKENLPLALRRLKDHVDYIHISDNGGSRMEHLALGEGKIRWDVLFETLEIIDFKSHIGIDIGGDESDVTDLDKAYKDATLFVSDAWHCL